MLGRTDSRARALLILVAFVVVAGSLGVRLAYWQVARRDELVGDGGQAVLDDATSSPRRAARSTTAPGPSCSRRASRATGSRRTPSCSTPQRRVAEVAAQLVAHARPRGRRGDQAHDPDEVRARVRRPRARPRPRRSPTGSASASAGDSPQLPGSCSSRSRCASTRSPAAGRTRRSRRTSSASSTATGQGQYGVEQFYQDQLAGMPRVVAAQKDASGNPVPDSSVVLEPGYARRRTSRSRSTRRSRSRSSRSCWRRGSPTARSACRRS